MTDGRASWISNIRNDAIQMSFHICQDVRISVLADSPAMHQKKRKDIVAISRALILDYANAKESVFGEYHICSTAGKRTSSIISEG